MKLGILLSGRGSNFEAIARNVLARKLDCEIGFVFSNKPGAPGLARARDLGLPCGVIESAGRDRTEFDKQVADLLRDHDVGLVCLAGYMRNLRADVTTGSRSTLKAPSFFSSREK